MTDNDDKEILILETIKTALIDGIDENGYAVGADDTPTYGGNESGEDFDTLNNAGEHVPFNIYVEYLDDMDEPGSPMLPAIVVSAESPVPQIDFIDRTQGFALTITLRVFVSEMDGHVSVGGTTYKNEKASRIFRKRIIDLLNHIQFPNVETYEHNDVSPLELGYPMDGDDWTIVSGASIVIQYIPEL